VIRRPGGLGVGRGRRRQRLIFTGATDERRWRNFKQVVGELTELLLSVSRQRTTDDRGSKISHTRRLLMPTVRVEHPLMGRSNRRSRLARGSQR